MPVSSARSLTQNDNGAPFAYPKLAALTSYEDPQSGISETFLTPEFGGARTVAVLANPLGSARQTHWVLCHSFSLEQINLQGFETSFVRLLGSSGWPSLRFHSQGYGDSEMPVDNVSLTSHVDGAVDAVEWLRDHGARRIGLIGGRFGGSVAALAADRTGAHALVMWEPVIKGREYLNAHTRGAILSRLTIRAQESDGAPASDPLDGLDDDEEEADLQGFPLTPTAREEIEGLDLLKALNSFAGAVCLVQISRSAERRPDLKRLAARLDGLGAQVTHEVVTFPQPHLFGRPRYQSAGDGGKADTQAELTLALTEHTIRWCDRLADASGEVMPS